MGVFYFCREFVDDDAVSTKRRPRRGARCRHCALIGAVGFWGGFGRVEVFDLAVQGVAFALYTNFVQEGAQEELSFGGFAFGEGGAHVVEDVAQEVGVDVGEGLQGGAGMLGLSQHQVRVLLFEVCEAAEEGGGFGAFGDGVGDVVDLAADGGEIMHQFRLAAAVRFELVGLAGGEGFGEVEHVLGLEDDIPHQALDFIFEDGARDAGFGTVAVAVGAGADVTVGEGAAAVLGGVSEEGRATLAAFGQAREEEATVGAARIVDAARVAGSGGGVVVLDLLDLFPEIAGYDGRTVVFYNDITILQDTYVQFVGPKGGEAVLGFVEAGLFVDDVQGCARGAQLEGA